MTMKEVVQSLDREGECPHTDKYNLCTIYVHKKIAHSIKRCNLLFLLLKMVGTAGFEPTTPTPPVWCATRLRYAPNVLIYAEFF